MLEEKLNVLVDILGDYEVQGRREYYFHCPFCNHHKRKLAINLEKNAYHCWVCDVSGKSARRIIKKFGNFINLKEWDRVNNIIELDGYEQVLDYLSNIEFNEQKVHINLPDEFITLTSKKHSTSSKLALNYLKKRGMNKEDILRWKVGFCPNGEYKGRVIFPSFNDVGRLDFFIGRSYRDIWPPYKNPNISKDIIFNELYIDWDDDVILVEGVFDAVKAKNSIPLLGSSMNENTKLLHKIVEKDSTVFLALDADAKNKSDKISYTLKKYDIEVYNIDTSGYKDIGEMSKEEFKERKKKATLVSDNQELYNAIMRIK